ncbi:MAG: hypothetical protein ACHQAX_05945 [Gammaproteobacteria bacterium]
MKQWIVLVLLLAFSMAHAGSPPPPPKDELAIIPFTIILNGAQSGIHPETQTIALIQDDAAWKAFWAKHNTISPPPASPNIDFAKNMVITVIDSDQPNSGYYLSLDKIEKHDEELWVYVTREQPAAACMNLGMVAQPFVFATLPKMPATVKLVFTTHMYAC